MLNQIPICYFPSTVVFVDDNQKYLRSLSLELEDKKFFPQFFSSPYDALDYLKDCTNNTLTGRFAEHSARLELDQRDIEEDINFIYNEVYNKRRFAEVSVIVVDYAMPGINGLEVCQKLKDKPFKKILLTGEADEIIAVKAFNSGIINKYIRKDSSDFYNLINKAIQGLQLEYFRELSASIVNLKNPLTEPKFIDFFQKYCRENEIIEYYLTDHFGSFMLFNFEGKAERLIIRNEIGMQIASQVAELSDNLFPAALLDAIKNRKIIYFSDKEQFTDNPEEFKKHLYPCALVPGYNDLYYVCMEGFKSRNIEREKITLYKNFLSSNETACL